MTSKAKTLLRRIGDTKDASLKLTPATAKAAGELVREGSAILIPISNGGAWVALTAKGVQQYEEQE